MNHLQAPDSGNVVGFLGPSEPNHSYQDGETSENSRRIVHRFLKYRQIEWEAVEHKCYHGPGKHDHVCEKTQFREPERTMCKLGAPLHQHQNKRDAIADVLKQQAGRDQGVEGKLRAQVKTTHDRGAAGRPDKGPDRSIERRWGNLSEVPVQRESAVSANGPGQSGLPSLDRPDSASRGDQDWDPEANSGGFAGCDLVEKSQS